MKKKRIPKRKKSVLKTGVAWYKPEQWARLLEISEDRDELEKTYKEWVTQAEEQRKILISEGIALKKVVIDVEALLAWCKERRRKVNGSSRTEYVIWLMQECDKNK